MTEVKVGLLENFAIKNWYRFVLYLGGVTLILSFFLEPKGITINELRAFSIWSIAIGLILWFLESIIGAIGDYWEYLEERGRISEYTLKDYTESIVLIWWIIKIIAFVFWVSQVLILVY
jgi:hypothetical protein